MLYHIKTEAFEGPLELLLDLIERKKLSISQVSLAGIADSYVAEVKSRAAVAPDEVAQFLVIASTLMLIKSRSLLPNLPVSGEEEANMRDLEERLANLRQFRALSRHIAARAAAKETMYARAALPDLPVLFYPPAGITVLSLHERMRLCLRALPQYIRAALPEKSIARIVSLEEKIAELMARVEQALAQSFRSFVATAKEKAEIIVSFLALLELVKQGQVVVEQKDRHGDIEIVQSAKCKVQN